MNQLQNALFPPQFNHHFDFADSDDFQQSDYEEGISINVGTHYFQPEWKPVVLSDCQNLNCFCPYCGRFVQLDAKNFGCLVEGTQQTCLSHEKCMSKKQNEQIQFQYTKSPYTISKGYLDVQKMGSTLGGKQYVLSSKIEHPLSSFKYFKMDKRLVIDDGQIFLNMEASKDDLTSFDPNIIIVPLPQINIKLNLREIGSEVQTQNISLTINLSQIFVGIQVTENHSVWVINSSQPNYWTTKVEIELIFDSVEKERLVSLMNFKYQHKIMETFPLVKINKILLRSKDYENKMVKSAIENTKASSSIEDICEQSDEESIGSSFKFIPIRICEPKVQQDIRSYSKTQGGSKQLQKRIRDMKAYEITAFIQDISPFIHQLLEDDYANYMIQTLVSVSNSAQRLQIFEILKGHITNLISLKQGTFAFQQMISFMVTHEQYELFSQKMSQNFFEIATNVNGNHFLRKLIPMLPFYYNEIIIRKIFDDFIELANNKNSVCVLKVILKKIAYENATEKVNHIKKKLIDTLTMNTQSIIKNEFGNYFIQEAYELLGQEQLKGISEMIFSKFRAFSKQKFSSSVICKCINLFWRNTDFYERLKAKLSQNQILELFRNKEGNKVLLELMSSQIDFAFKNKISSAISNDLPSKFNGSKWSNSTGSKTGRVGNQNYTNFSDAMKDCDQKNGPVWKKKYYNYNIQ